MPGTSKTFIRRAAPAAALAAALCLVMACTARAADSIYWLNSVSNTISHANLAGGGGGEVPIPSELVDNPGGMGIDARSGKLYWTNNGGDPPSAPSIASANLDGSAAGVLNVSGAPIDEAFGLSIDAAAGKVYWAIESKTAPTISFANLSGGGGGVLNTAGVTPEGPATLVVYPAAGKIYWDDDKGIAFANLGGGGGGILVPGADSPVIEASSNRIYWIENNTIQFMSLNGGPVGVLNIPGAILENAFRLAIDPGAGRIYWANSSETNGPNNNTIWFASLDGSGGRQLDTSGATVSLPGSLVLLKTPLATAPPLVKGRQRGGSLLSCESSWAGDLPESFLYRVPQTVAYRWLRNGRPIAGAITQSVKASKVGRYACQAIATNFAGSASSTTSAAVNVKAALKLGKLRLNRAAGTATLKVAAFGAGRLTLKGTGIKRRIAKASPKARLGIRPTGQVEKRLKRAGSARVKVKIAFRPSGGKAIRRSKTIVLRAR